MPKAPTMIIYLVTERAYTQRGHPLDPQTIGCTSLLWKVVKPLIAIVGRVSRTGHQMISSPLWILLR